MGEFKPSKYQVDIYDKIEEGLHNILVNAVAGSGKSTTIINALKIVPRSKRLLFLAFNKAIVEELKEKIGEIENVYVKTLHSLGFSIINDYHRTKIENDKYKNFVRKGIEERRLTPKEYLDYNNMNVYKSNILALVDLCRVNLCNSKEEAEEIAYKYDIFPVDNEIEICSRVIGWGMNNIDTIDFTDMIYLPVKLNMRTPQYDWVFIDECQDLNAAQRELFLKCVKPDGHWVAVGDPRQAIYGFAGADEKSFNLLSELDNVIQLPLSVCYRCDSSIINKAKSLVPQIEARDNAPEGLITYDCKPSEVQDGDMILCRITAPLVELCLKYISQGTKAYIKGKDIGMNLIKLIEDTNKKKSFEVLDVLDDNAEKLLKKIMKKKNCTRLEAEEDSKYNDFLDKIQVVELLSKGYPTTYSVIKRINDIFSNDKGEGICLSTVHKSKGLEADCVYILNPQCFYLSRAMKIDWMAEQEKNLVYVAVTRAKHYLGYIDLSEKKDTEESRYKSINKSQGKSSKKKKIDEEKDLRW